MLLNVINACKKEVSYQISVKFFKHILLNTINTSKFTKKSLFVKTVSPLIMLIRIYAIGFE